MIWTVQSSRGPIVVREQIEPDDEPGVLRVFEQSADYFEAATGAPPAPGDVQSLFYALPEGSDYSDKRLFTMRDGDEIVGVIDAVLRHPSVRSCAIGLFVILPGYRRAGIGASVATTMFSELRDLDFDEVTAAIPEGWDPGRRFARALGFELEPIAEGRGNRRVWPGEAATQRATLDLRTFSSAG